MKKATPNEQGVLTLIILALAALLILLASISDAHAQYDAFLDQENPYAALVEEQKPPMASTSPAYPDGWYYIEAFSCATCPSAKSEIGALVKAGWKITLVDEREDFTKWAKPETLPAVIGVSRGRVVQRIHYPFDRWDVSAASKSPQRKEQATLPELQYVEKYVPTYTSPRYTYPGDIYSHLLSPPHNFRPEDLQGLSHRDLEALHDDWHTGRLQRVRVQVQTTPTTALPSRLPASNQQYVQSSQFAAPNWQAQGYAFCPTGAG